MNTYEITYMEFNRGPEVVVGKERIRVVRLGTREGTSARKVLDAFAAEKGVADAYTHGNRNSIWGLGAPTLKARKVTPAATLR